jgi:hypothetical protein
MSDPTHAAIINVIKVEIGEVKRRLDQGERRFDRLEERLTAADEARTIMAADLAAIKATASAPWWLGWRPVAVGLALAVLAGAGLTALTIAGLDILPKLTAIKEAVQ